MVFAREHDRYTVIKTSDMTDEQRVNLGNFLELSSIDTRACVVVEKNWPMYDRVWGLIEDWWVSENTEFDSEGNVKVSIFDNGWDDATIWRALHDTEFRSLMSAEGRAQFPLPCPPVKNTPDTFYTRLVAERDELSGKLDKLNDFILGDVFPTLDDDPRRLLQRQALSMTGYLDILGARITLLDKADAETSAAIDKLMEPAQVEAEPNWGCTTNREIEADLMQVEAGDDDSEIIETRVTGGGSNETPIAFRDDTKSLLRPATAPDMSKAPPAPGTRYKPDGFA